MEKITTHKIGLAVFKDRKILMARSKKNPEIFYFPGGKPEASETDAACLQRETMEELSAHLDTSSIKLIGEFSAPIHDKPNYDINLKLYSATLLDEPAPSSEIAEIQYFDSTIPYKHTDALVMKIFAYLQEHNYIL